MKKKGVAVTIFFGFILLSSTIMLVLPGIDPGSDSPELTVTGTPADNFPDEQRSQFCGSSNAKSTNFVQEFSIPTLCTNPLAIVTDYDGTYGLLKPILVKLQNLILTLKHLLNMKIHCGLQVDVQ